MRDPSDLVPVRDLPSLPPRSSDAHKGSFGKVLVVAGSQGMSGAAVLAGSAALRGGAGLVQVAVPEPIGPIVATSQPCYVTTWLPADVNGRLVAAALATICELAKAASVVVAGPGLGQSPELRCLIQGMLHEVDQPLVLDADALNLLASEPGLLRQRAGPFVITPHPGEFARLLASDTRTVQASRQERAVAFAREHGGVVLLKGAGTLVTDGRRVYTNTTGNPGMATGGTGDVLSGLLGALIAQGLAPFEAAVLGAYLHGKAGDLAREKKGEVSLIATDLLDELPAAIRSREPST